MEIKLVKIDDKGRSKGGGFMKGVEKGWELEFPEQVLVCMTLETMHLLFKKNRR